MCDSDVFQWNNKIVIIVIKISRPSFLLDFKFSTQTVSVMMVCFIVIYNVSYFLINVYDDRGLY